MCTGILYFLLIDCPSVLCLSMYTDLDSSYVLHEIDFPGKGWCQTDTIHIMLTISL